VREAEQMGFNRIVLPASNMDASEAVGKADRLRQGDSESSEADAAKVELIGVRSVGEALDVLIV